MGKHYDELSEDLIQWIRTQKSFFVASAALAGEGHVNMSPKGHTDDTFILLEKNKVAYLDLTGSGVETISHLKEPGNARLTIMWVSFETSPNIVRCWGKGKAYERGTPEFDQLMAGKKVLPGSRAVIVLDVHKVGTSCGWSIPFVSFSTFLGGFQSNHVPAQYKYEGERPTLTNWAEKREAEAPANEKLRGVLKNQMEEYHCVRNAQSLDGLVGLEVEQAKAGVKLGDPLVGPPVFSDSPYVKPKLDWLLVPAAAYLAYVGGKSLGKKRGIAVADLLVAAAVFIPGKVPKDTIIAALAGLLGLLAGKKGDRNALGLLAILAISAGRK